MLEKTYGEIKNGRSRDTGIWHRTQNEERKHTKKTILNEQDGPHKKPG